MEKSGTQQKAPKEVWTTLTLWISLCFAFFQLIVPVFFQLVDLQLKAIHIIFGVSIVIITRSLKKNVQAGIKLSIWDWVLIFILIAANINIFFSWMNIYMTPGEGRPIDWVLGALVTLVLLEAARRSTGSAMPICVGFMFIYVFLLGPFLPGGWGHPGFSFEFVMESVYFSPNGMYGSITGYSSTFIGVMIIFGSLLLFTGGGETFMDLALLTTGRFRGGPAKVAVVASALFGMISGSPTANVSVTGTYTIPLMKQLGYQPNFAGGVEAMASTGGIITPPIMGITAFIMAELLGMSYVKIIFYAIIPCILYYTGLFAGVHFEALRLQLPAVPKEGMPHWKTVLTWSRLVPFSIPLAILIGLLLKGFDLTSAGFYSCMAVIVFYLFSDFSFTGMKKRILQIGKALSDGGKSLSTIVPVMVVCGMLVNLLGITGIAPKVSELIINLGGQSLIGALLTAAIVPLVLGTALPTSASYILAVPLILPALLQLKIDNVAAHMFLFYWAALAAVTPPTCVPCVIGANLAGGNWLKVAWVGMRLGIVAFFMPFFFVLEPALLARGSLREIVIHSFSGMIGAVLLASGLFGYMRSKTNILIRFLYLVGGVLLLWPGFTLSLVGAGIAVLAFLGESLFIKLKRAPQLKMPS